jgi:hypothetical protein
MRIDSDDCRGNLPSVKKVYVTKRTRKKTMDDNDAQWYQYSSGVTRIEYIYEIQEEVSRIIQNITNR